MVLLTISWLLFVLAGLALLVLVVGTLNIPRIRARRSPPPARWPKVSLLKPLCGLDEGLWQNLSTHAEQDYPGEVEILLGVRDEKDAAYPLAQRFVAAHPGRARIVIQKSAPGLNPKVNQLIALTRASNGELLVVTDSNVRVPRSFLTDAAAALMTPGVGIATNLIAGSGERTLGAALDNLQLNAFIAPTMASAGIAGLGELIGKAVGISRTNLARIGGWTTARNILAEDRCLARRVTEIGLKIHYCPLPIENMQFKTPVAEHFNRQARWSMIRWRYPLPWIALEPLTLPSMLALIAFVLSPRTPVYAELALAVVAAQVALAEASSFLLRGHGVSLRYLLLVPFGDLVHVAALVRGAFMNKVVWRGNEVWVLPGTRITEPAAYVRWQRMTGAARSASRTQPGVKQDARFDGMRNTGDRPALPLI
jgi:ceramide glucosyltransferase